MISMGQTDRTEESWGAEIDWSRGLIIYRRWGLRIKKEPQITPKFLDWENGCKAIPFAILRTTIKNKRQI